MKYAVVLLLFAQVASAQPPKAPPVSGLPPKAPPVALESPPVAFEDSRGIWSPWWDGTQWHARWLTRGGTSREATPFPVEPGVSIPTTSATTVGRSSTQYPGSTATGRIITLAPGAAIPGVTNCPPGIP